TSSRERAEPIQKGRGAMAFYEDLRARGATLLPLLPTLAVAAAIGALPWGGALAGATSTSLSKSPGTTTFGESVEFTATVMGGAPSGTVTFWDGASKLGSGAVTLLGAASTLPSDS